MSSLKDITLFLEDAEKELYAEPMSMTSSARNAADSVDDQIDSFLINFENESLVAKEDLVMESLKQMSLKALLEQDAAAEAEETEPEGVEVDAEAEEAEVSEPTGSERIKVDEPLEAEPRLPLDVDAFGKRVARLVLNGPTLLDLRTVIVNRALNYLSENYDEQHAKSLLEVLDEQFDFNINDAGEPAEDHYAAGAYAGGASATPG
tara:strand:- start:215 stop:832 length:618 start_codon:yes stop_codon:yes gene_type:complete